MMHARLAAAVFLLTGSAAITHASPAAESTTYTVPQLFHLLRRSAHALAGKQVTVSGRAALALWVNPVPGMPFKRWRTGDLNAATCRTGAAAGCQPRGFLLHRGWFVFVRLVPTQAGPIAGNPAAYVPGIWLKVVPSPAWAKAGAQRIHYGSSTTYRVRVRHVCVNIFCSDVVLIPGTS